MSVTSGSPTQSPTDVADEAALALVNDTPLRSGDMASTESGGLSLWTLSRTATDAPGADVVVPRSGYGRWLRNGGAGSVTFAAVKAALAAATSSVDFNGQQVTHADGTTASAGATTGQTYFLNPNNPGDGVALPQIDGPWYPWGGTVASPESAETIFRVQPRDRTRPPFALYGTVGLFNTTFDYVLALGYNRFNERPASTAGAWVIETDYEESPGVHKSEAYFEWFQVGGAYGSRPFFTSLDWTTGAGTVGHEFGVAGSVVGFWSVSSANNGQAIKAQDDAVFIIRDALGVFDRLLSYQALGWSPDGGFNFYDKPAYGGARRITTGNAKHTITLAISTIVDPVAKDGIQQLCDALGPSGMDIVNLVLT